MLYLSSLQMNQVSDEFQKVSENGAGKLLPYPLESSCRVLQASLLSFMLFNIYITLLRVVVGCTIISFF